MEHIFTKDKSLLTKGIAILVMLAHHLYGFPDRMEYLYESPFLLGLGIKCSIVVGLFVFISGYGLSATSLSPRKVGQKVFNLWTEFLLVFIIFVPLGLILQVYKFNSLEFLENLFFIDASYNKEWWFLSLYIKLILIALFLSFFKNNWLLGATALILCVFSTIARSINLSIVPLDIKSYLPVFLLGYCTNRYSLFEVTDNCIKKVFHNKFVRVALYVIIAIVIGHSFDFIHFLSLFFWVLSFSLLDLPEFLVRILRILGNNALFIWLVHTFFCYYFCKNLFIAIKDPILGYVVLLILSLAASVILTGLYRWMKLQMGKILKPVLKNA